MEYSSLRSDERVKEKWRFNGSFKYNLLKKTSLETSVNIIIQINNELKNLFNDYVLKKI